MAPCKFCIIWAALVLVGFFFSSTNFPSTSTASLRVRYQSPEFGRFVYL